MFRPHLVGKDIPYWWRTFAQTFDRKSHVKLLTQIGSQQHDSVINYSLLLEQSNWVNPTAQTRLFSTKTSKWSSKTSQTHKLFTLSPTRRGTGTSNMLTASRLQRSLASFTSCVGLLLSLVSSTWYWMEVLVTFRLAPEFGLLYSSLSQEDLASEGHEVKASVLWCPPWWWASYPSSVQAVFWSRLPSVETSTPTAPTPTTVAECQLLCAADPDGFDHADRSHHLGLSHMQASLLPPC